RPRRGRRHVGLRRPQQGPHPGRGEGDSRFAAEGDRRRPHPPADRPVEGDCWRAPGFPAARGAMSAWTDVADGIRVRTSRLYAMNSLVVFEGDHALLVDPGVLPSEIEDMARAVRERVPRFERVSLALTHPHWDHVLGLPWFPGATTLAHAGFADELATKAE